MTTGDVIVIAINMLLALAAGIVNHWAGARSSTPWRSVWYRIAALAYVYAAAYVVLLINPTMIVQWSSVMRGVSLTVWPVIWAAPALVTVRALRSFEDHDDQRGDT